MTIIKSFSFSEEELKEFERFNRGSGTTSSRIMRAIKAYGNNDMSINDNMDNWINYIYDCPPQNREELKEKLNQILKIIEDREK